MPPATLSEEDKSYYESVRATEKGPSMTELLNKAFTPEKQAKVVGEIEFLVRNLKDDIGKKILASTNAKVIPNAVRDLISLLKSGINDLLANQINEILHNKEFQRLEASWRGLHHLVSNSRTGKQLQIKILNANADEIREDLKEHKAETMFNRSAMYQKIYSSGYDMLGGTPFGCLVGDFQFTERAPDMEMLQEMAKIAAAAHAPFISAASSEMFNLGKNWRGLNKITDIQNQLLGSEYVPLNNFRDSADARYVGLTMPRFLARLPYGKDSSPVKELPLFEEFPKSREIDGHNPQDYGNFVWSNAAYALAARVNTAFVNHGWCANIRGPEAGGTVENLPYYQYRNKSGNLDLTCPTEQSFPLSRENELSQCGLIPLVYRENSTKAVFMGANSLYYPKKYVGGKIGEAATANDVLSSRLPYMFAMSRVMHYIKRLAIEKIGRSASPESIKNMLQQWINDYVEENPTAQEEVRAKKPFRHARIEVTEDPKNPGFFNVGLEILPAFQLEGLAVKASLVARRREDLA